MRKTLITIVLSFGVAVATPAWAQEPPVRSPTKAKPAPIRKPQPDVLIVASHSLPQAQQDNQLPQNPAMRRLHLQVQQLFTGHGAGLALIRGGATVIIRWPFP